jgi:DNA-binding MarR family transcriptional regulator
MITTSEEAAHELLEVVPAVMKEIRAEMRNRRTLDLTVPQFRALAFVDKNKDASLSVVANHMGLTLPTTSRLIDLLIARGFLTREDDPSDRRRLKLAVTKRGLTILDASRRGTLDYLVNKLNGVDAEDRQLIVEGMKALRLVFINDAQIKAGVK